jgi:hypothetical protein
MYLTYIVVPSDWLDILATKYEAAAQRSYI